MQSDDEKHFLVFLHGSVNFGGQVVPQLRSIEFIFGITFPMTRFGFIRLFYFFITFLLIIDVRFSFTVDIINLL